jgi:SAM-dependent methyltransferase
MEVTKLATQRDVWTEDEVVDVTGADLVLRTYIEQAEVRRYLAHVAHRTELSIGCDVGAGYGRMSSVLKEFCDCVVAFEREVSLVHKGANLLPTVQYRQIDSLKSLPASDDEFDFALSFTVLQHLSDTLAKATIAEIHRIVRRDGYVLLCEETNDAERVDRPVNPHADYTARSLELYKEWMAPFQLVASSPRLIERSYPRKNVGEYMLFCARPTRPASG